MTPPGQDTNPSQVSPHQKLVLIYTAESIGAIRVKCLAQGHTTQWSGRGWNSRRPGYESDRLTSRPLRRSLVSDINSFPKLGQNNFWEIVEKSSKYLEIFSNCIEIVQSRALQTNVRYRNKMFGITANNLIWTFEITKTSHCAVVVMH